MTDLDRELSTESTSYQELALESSYARFGTIAGPALNDSFHFGQTWWNDFGRPQGRGSNFIAGFSTRAHYGRLFFYAREEYQHSPGNPQQTVEQNQFINQLDRIQPEFSPYSPIIQQRSCLRTAAPPRALRRLLLRGQHAFTFGKQQLYWGPTTMGPLAFSSNAEPTHSGRFCLHAPPPPTPCAYLGNLSFRYRARQTLRALRSCLRPWFNGQKISFNFGNNLEIGFTRWSVVLGVGSPHHLRDLSAKSLQHVLDRKLRLETVPLPMVTASDPGDRKSNFDFRYKLPFLQKIVTLYADAYPTTTPTPSLRRDAPSGTPASTSLVFPGCRIWTCVWKPSAPRALPPTSVGSTTS